MGIVVKRGNDRRDGRSRRADLGGLGIPFGDQSLRKIHRDVHGLFFVGVKVNHRRFHALEGEHRAFAESEVAGGPAVETGGFPVIDELWQARSFQRPPIEQHAIGALNGSERAPFVGGEISVVASHEADQAPCCGAEREAEQQAAGACGETQMSRKGEKVLGFHAPNLLSFEIGVVIGGQKNCKRVVISGISGNLRLHVATVGLTIRQLCLQFTPAATIRASSAARRSEIGGRRSASGLRPPPSALRLALSP